jgi:hypothetical protein
MKTTAVFHLNWYMRLWVLICLFVAATAVSADPDKKVSTPQISTSNFGIENGTRATDTEQTLSQLDYDSPGQVEIILSYVTKKDPAARGNPFGHIALRIGNSVFTANEKAKLFEDPAQLHETTLEDYLYGVEKKTANANLGSTHGMVYLRDNLGLRVNGVSQERLKAMQNEIKVIEKEWQEGKGKWNAVKCNCADYVVRVLKAGGLGVGSYKVPTMPLEVFHKAVRLTDKNPKLATSIVRYERAADSKHEYKYTAFPLSIFKLGPVLRSLIGWERVDLWKGKESAIVSIPHGFTSTKYRNVDNASFGDWEARTESFLNHFTANENKLNEPGFLLDMAYQASGLAVEKMSFQLTPSQLAPLKQSFTALSKEYRRFREINEDSEAKDLAGQNFYTLFNKFKTKLDKALSPGKAKSLFGTLREMLKTLPNSLSPSFRKAPRGSGNCIATLTALTQLLR